MPNQVESVYYALPSDALPSYTLERITSLVGIQSVLVPLCLLYFHRSTVAIDRAKKDSAGYTPRIKSPDLIEHARRAVQGNDLSDMIKMIVDFEDELRWKVPKLGLHLRR